MYSTLYWGSIGLVVVSSGYWLLRMRGMKTEPVSVLRVLFAVFSLLNLCAIIHVLNIYMSDHYDYREDMSLFALAPLYFFPILVLILKTVVDVKTPGLLSFAFYLLPTTIYSTFVAFLYFMYGADRVIGTPWMREVDVVLYNYLIFINILIGIIVIVWKSMTYFHHSRNFFSDREMSDCSSVRGICQTAITVGVIFYLVLLLSYNSFADNLGWTCTVVILMCIEIHILGYSLYKVKGVAAPADFVWTPTNLSLEKMEALEQRFKESKELLSVENATKNISAVIDKWLDAPNPSYLNAGITLTQTAYEMKIPANLLSGYINRTLDMNFNQWINSYRLKHVKYLLSTTNKTLDEIAELSGFTNRSFLSRTFKAHEGITPSEYRENMSKTKN